VPAESDLIVCDTSPIRALAHLNLLPLLGSLYARVLIPPAVAAELSVPVEGQASFALSSVKFITIVTPAECLTLTALLRELDRGESEAISLAVELGLRQVLIDEARGRAVARRFGLTPIGVLAVLLAAKRSGMILAMAPLIDRLMSEMNFRISTSLRSEVLRLAGEGT